MTYIQLGDGTDISLVYGSGEWNVATLVTVDTNHHFSKTNAPPREVIDTFGDINKCIASIPSHYTGQFDEDIYLSIRQALVTALNNVSEFSKTKLDNKQVLTIRSPVSGYDYTIEGNAYSGITLSYAYTIVHARSDGFSRETRYYSSLAQAGERLIGIEMGEYAKQSNISLSDILQHMITFSNSLQHTFNNTTHKV